jgi:hypothetical protein
MGVAMLANGAQATDIEASLRGVMRALGLPGAEAVVTYSTVSISFVAPGDAEATTALQLVRDWRPDYSQLAALRALAREIRGGRADLERTEAELTRIGFKVIETPADPAGGSRAYVNPWIVEHRFRGKAELFERTPAGLAKIEYPPTNMVLVGQRE